METDGTAAVIAAMLLPVVCATPHVTGASRDVQQRGRPSSAALAVEGAHLLERLEQPIDRRRGDRGAQPESNRTGTGHLPWAELLAIRLSLLSRTQALPAARLKNHASMACARGLAYSHSDDTAAGAVE